MTTEIRGETLTFSAPCTDNAGNPSTPTSANLYLVYILAATAALTKQVIAMTITDNVVSATFDTSIVADGQIVWSIKAVGVGNVIADGTIDLTANGANPAS